ncbi:MAG: hypothetical protein A2Y98_01770 [Candidatus Portnoybacteria bacterium RBG_19FT_COMBO_36_7]|uniref:Uncharacterized protein n=1 Tax=Candidatus Portnoybacteria bacterium RBG_19FT_COMBO_36_7 TaxID=1801992 RepID=A0A1G2F7N8_9BACT|nr:MAG: hypothetical protein A2Y98_01770 [Candidatus Portnoybacteria bacterium RBG_19FT_COMBO_36_7]
MLEPLDNAQGRPSDELLEPPKNSIIMIMKKTFYLFIFMALAGLFLAGQAQAHQPRIVSGQETAVQNPEISQAFYGELKGQPQLFEINSENDFVLYVNILVPDLPGANKGIKADIYRIENGDQQLVAELGGENFDWSKFFEPFGGDSYLKGPEYREQAEKGRYLVSVSSSQNSGKYSLAIGSQESFPLKEILKTIALLPVLKMDFFERSPLTAYFNYTGLFLLGTLIILFLAIFLVIKLAKKLRKKDNPVTF